MDGTFVVWEHGRSDLQQFRLQERIQFTIEVEENEKYFFLNVLVSRTIHSISTRHKLESDCPGVLLSESRLADD